MKFGRRTGKDDDGEATAGSQADKPDPGSSRRGRHEARGQEAKRGYLDGQMLIAMPSMGDDRFARSVIYICAHSSDGAMGIVVNQPASHISFADLLVQL